MGRHRASLCGLITSAVVCSALVVVSPAQANTTISTDCATSSTESLTLFVGETLTINTIGGDCAAVARFSIGGFDPGGGTGDVEYSNTATPSQRVMYSGGTPFIAPDSSVVYTATVVGGARLHLLNLTPFDLNWDITVVAAPEPTPDVDPSVTAQVPASLIQQFGKPDVGSCEDAAWPEMNWAGVASGGWSESWAQWMHDGNGGVVCTRTLEYHQGHSRWMVN